MGSLMGGEVNNSLLQHVSRPKQQTRRGRDRPEGALQLCPRRIFWFIRKLV